ERKEHRELVQLISQYQWKEVILVGREFEGLSDLYKRFDNSEEAAEYIRKGKPENASILIKGSRGSKMEVLLEALKS
ncbi:MAG TPA: UDP-N-acetylmuramoylalanyl-D-glutamate--2,6-diaminopimelate ligase, partial [Flavipsychrobacter sp.]|nr:UDP-N-acetylmuramoylalanyl-D-glutamate--2,6-diaminopimelate ligase [Flavipsychrobacter sp.]